ncbi:MAG: ZIP family metal transporter [Lachnospiraceae bacterium]|nr:ZIP family metal transporter [Lachnospiraceae bacterium]
MEIVLLTAIGVGGATIVGSLLGFIIKKPSHKFNDIVLAFAAGIMLSAAVFGLIFESVELGGKYSLLIMVAGVFAGAICVNAMDRLIPHLHKLTGVEPEAHPDGAEKMNKVLLFVIAIAIHNLPEGIAAGVGFGTGNAAEALTIAGGIALQNIPEGMVIIAPMLATGMKRGRVFLIAMATGVVEVIGTLLGFFAVSISSAILPFALAFAGGTMLYVISDEMIPETHSHGNERGATYSLILGFCVMLIFDTLLA